MISQKKCVNCGLVKEVEFFPKRKHSKDGYHCYCRPCTRERNKEWRHRPHVKERHRQIRRTEKNRAIVRESMRKYREKNREEILEFNRTPLGRAKKNLYRMRWRLKKANGPKRRAAIMECIAFWESEVERLSS